MSLLRKSKTTTNTVTMTAKTTIQTTTKATIIKIRTGEDEEVVEEVAEEEVAGEEAAVEVAVVKPLEGSNPRKRLPRKT